MDQVRFGVVGCGGIAALAHLPALAENPRTALYAIADVDSAKVAEQGDKYNVPNRFTDYKEMLALDEVDAVIVSTPVFLHHDLVIDALSAGKHVLSEKPLALDVPQAQSMVRAAEEHGRLLGVMHQQRYSDAAVQIRKILDSGAIGKLLSFTARGGHGGPEVRVPGSAMATWAFDKSRAGGGVLFDTGVHMIDFVCWLFGDVDTVNAEMATLSRDIQVEDEARLLLRMSSGIVGVAEFSWSQLEGRHGLEIYGTDGVIIFDRSTGDVRVAKRIKPVEEAVEWSTYEFETHPWFYWHRFLIDAFADAVAGGSSPVPTGAEALRTQRVLDAAYVAAETGQRVKL